MTLEQIQQYFDTVLSERCAQYQKPTVSIDIESTMSDAVKYFERRKEVFCVYKNNPYVLTARAVLNKRRLNENMKIRPFLIPIPKITQRDKLFKIAQVMNRFSINAVPILQKNTITGEIRLKDILKKLHTTESSWILAKQVMQKPYFVSNTDSINKARKIMISHKTDFVPVMKNDKISRVISSNQIISMLDPPQRVGSLGTRGKKKIRSLDHEIQNMGVDSDSCKTNSALSSVLQSMIQNNPVVLVKGDGKLRGVITFSDILNLSTNKAKSDIPIYITGRNEIPRSVLARIASALKKFSTSVSEVEEARISVDVTNTEGNEKKFNLVLNIFTATKTLSYSASAWSIPEIAENIIDKVTRQVSKQRKNRNKKTMRKQRPSLYR